MCTLCAMNPASTGTGSHDLMTSVSNSSTMSEILGDAPVTGVSTTGDQNIDALLTGTKWSNSTITYSFPNSVTDYDSFDQSSHGSSFSQFSSKQQASVEWWLESIEDVTGLNFVEYTGSLDDDAVLKFSNGNASTAFAYTPSSNYWAGDSWYGNAGDFPDHGDYDWHTIGHEIGHTLGLLHGHDATNPNGAMESDYDAMEYSIMTYKSYKNDPLIGGYSNSSFSYAQSLMIYDIAALQHMYGADYSTNSGNSNYTWDASSGAFSIGNTVQFDAIGSVIFHTVWDGGGDRDHYNFSNFTTNLMVDLRPGYYTDLDKDGNEYAANLGDGNYAPGQIYNALLYNGNTASIIERATGGSGNDDITGNQADNYIWGGLGDDVINGLEGVDKIRGGGGEDTINGGGGIDTIRGNGDNDTINGDAGDDRLQGGGGNDIINGGADNDTLRGNAGNDTLNGESGNDRINGGSGNDDLSGGSGNDIVTGKTGNDDLNGNSGNDELAGGRDDDNFIFDNLNDLQTDTILDFGDGNDKIVIHGYTYGDLVITPNGTGSTITVGNTTIEVLNYASNLLDASKFTFVPAGASKEAVDSMQIADDELRDALVMDDTDAADEDEDREPEVMEELSIYEYDDTVFEF